MANFELTREYIENLRLLIEQKDEETLLQLLGELHPADIAEIYEELSIEEAKYLYFLLDDDTAADVLIELEEEDRLRFLKALPSEVIARRFIDKMDSDDAVDVLSELDEERQKEVLSFLNDISVAGDIVDLLHYKENSAGGLMAKELIKVKESWSIITCLRSMRRQAEEVDEVYFVYVVDNDGILKGTLSLKKMLLSATDTIVKDIYNPDVISVNADVTSEEVSNIMNKYDLVVLPVTDSIGRLVGRITIDDVVDVMREEAEKDYQLASGITHDVEVSDSVFRHTKARIPWLMIGLVGGLFGSRVISVFEGNIDDNPQVAFFMPLIAAMGGNVGIQSSAIMVQSLASGSLGIESNLKKLLKELSVALLNATALALLVFAYNMAIGSVFALTLTVASAMFSVVMFASLFGTFLPLFLHKLKIDPAMATGPFITTLNDISGMFVYLLLAAYFFGVFV
ncbi:magnesium transporter [Alkalitalea saponilacus]|uniref:Magnesium transporter MgtE n=1 Tax=Alkalitalea saponilacus TaxID=889453 RepID=A0A1T5HTP6_9BACT|nr:magnesium transporter [Alkalitalea saponilacus]ASB48944.1 magnesium transporter [Alkalitalea saponilacus]SKC23911.1 magnesium transporter [Alkalitalea saponilacus]